MFPMQLVDRCLVYLLRRSLSIVCSVPSCLLRYSWMCVTAPHTELCSGTQNRKSAAGVT